jgi:hypothetical protein
MNTLILFALEIALCLGISFAMIWLLTPLLRDVLTDTCGTAKRAEFWVMFTQLMLIISPLLVVVFYAPTATITHINIAHELQRALFRTLLGDFIGLCIIGRVIWKSINNFNDNQAAMLIAQGDK